VTFSNGARKLYDCRPLLGLAAFQALREEWLFRLVHADPGGYGVIWTDEIDLSESELWEHGQPVEEEKAPDCSSL